MTERKNERKKERIPFFKIIEKEKQRERERKRENKEN